MTDSGLNQGDDGVTIVNTGCCHDCGGRCVLRAHVKDGEIILTGADQKRLPQRHKVTPSLRAVLSAFVSLCRGFPGHVPLDLKALVAISVASVNPGFARTRRLSGTLG